MIKINQDDCKGCGLCVRYCPKSCITLSPEVNESGYNFSVYKEGCTSCRFCAMMCPDACIEVER